jgi:hypothetical protein
MTEEITWKSLRDRARTIPQKLGLDLAIAHLSPDPYATFIDLVNRGILWSSTQLSKNKNIVQGMNEDQLTTLLLAPLLGAGFIGYHDANVGGHCDIYVEFDDERIWLGEAKIHSDYGTLYGGFQQLSERYSTGLAGQDRGGFIIYIFNKNAGLVMKTWLDYLAENFSGIKMEFDPNTMVGETAHAHVGSGRSMGVVHYPVVLHHDPTDVKPPPPRKRN